jgi:uncharacterized protein (DUF952 family)
VILHIIRRDDWLAARSAGIYRPSSLEREGFIHFSLPEQVIHVANAWYRGADDLVLLVVDPAGVGSELRYEEPEPRAPLFPHLYGPLDPEAVVRVLGFPEGDEGFELPVELDV